MNFVIGDVQGCLTELKKLLKIIRFNDQHDILWFTGDLVNRGRQSLETLRFIKKLGDHHPVVLGNHDLHLLAVYHKAHAGFPGDTLSPILSAPDCDELMAWLIKKPLLYHDTTSAFTLVHAGLAPQWTLGLASKLAKEVEAVLQSEEAFNFLKNMYGNHPNHWHESLQGLERWRCITNYFTRMRLCYPDGSLELHETPQNGQKNLMPWFTLPTRENKHIKILFGHWAQLGGVTNQPNVFGLDTGCVWGQSLTAMRLEDQHRYSVSCSKKI